MATGTGSFKQDLKTTAVRNIAQGMMRQGFVGQVLGKRFQEKYAPEEEDNRLLEALQQQNQLQEQVTSTLVRIESVVMNISDNVYNLAGIMNNQVVSMQEAQRIQKERMYAQEAAREESSAEALKMPSVAATTPGAEGQGEGKGGMLSSILGNVAGTKKMFGTFLKSFGIVAVGIISAIGALTFIARTFGRKGNEDTPQPETPGEAQPPAPQAAPGPTPAASDTGAGGTPEEQPQGASGNDQAVPTPTTPEPPPSPPPAPEPVATEDTSPFSFMTKAIRGTGTARAGADADVVGNLMSGKMDFGSIKDAVGRHQATVPQQPVEMSQAVPAAGIPPAQAEANLDLNKALTKGVSSALGVSLPEPQMPVAAPTPAPTPPAPQIQSAPTVASIETPLTPEEEITANEGNIERNNKRLAQREKMFKINVETWKRKYANDPEKLKEVTDKAERDLDAYREDINNANKGIGARIEVLKKQKTVPTADTSAPSPGMQGPTTAPIAAPPPPPEPVPPAPSSGQEINTQSANIAAAATAPPPPVVENSAVNLSSSTGIPPKSPMPSPVADRGSLDIDATFNSGE